jgi:choline dehydrogenase
LSLLSQISFRFLATRKINTSYDFRTDINLVLEQLPAVTPETAARFGAPPADAFTIAPALVQPTSRGSVRLASNNFQDAAVIDGAYLGTDRDFQAIVRAIEAARELGNQHAFDSVREHERRINLAVFENRLLRG